MAKAHQQWRVLPHLPIETVADNLWRVQGTLEGMGLKRVMTVARCKNGGLVLHSPIALDDDAMEKLEAWGAPAYILVPNGYHRLDARIFEERYPSAKVLCPEGSRRKVEEVVGVDGVYEDFPSGSVRLETLDGVGRLEGVMIVRSDDGATLVFNDLIFNQPHAKGAAGFVFRYLTASTGGPTISRIVRWFVIKDPRRLREHLERLAAVPDLRRIIVSHHRMITEDPVGVLRAVAATL